MAKAKKRPKLATTVPMATEALGHLERARAALRTQDFAMARDALIEAWQCRRSPIVADLVAVIAERAPDELAKELAAIVTPRVATTHKNFQAVAAIDDPRVSGFAIEALVRLPFTARTARDFLHDLVKCVLAHGDTRVLAHLEAIATGFRTRLNLLAIRKNLEAHLRDGANDLELPSPSAEEVAIAREIEAVLEPLRKTTRSAEALLADVYANPDDDAPRLVLADLLLERGDPRGELITLQIERGDGEPTEREKELLKKHGKQWLGNLSSVLSWGRGYSGTKFRRGFVAVADIILSVGKKLVPLREDPAWATVEALDGSWDDGLLMTAPLRALRHLERQPDYDVLIALANKPLAGVRTMRIVNINIDVARFRAAFPNVREASVFHRSFDAQRFDMLEKLGFERVQVTHNWVIDRLKAAKRDFAKYIDELVGKPAPFASIAFEEPYLSKARGKPKRIELRRDAHGNYERV